MSQSEIYTPTPYSVELKRLPLRPFIRIDNFCIAIARIVSVEFLPDATINEINGVLCYREISEIELKEVAKIRSFTAPVVIVNFINQNDMKDFIRRWGEEAESVWKYVTEHLASP
jgi:hypothetical protein